MQKFIRVRTEKKFRELGSIFPYSRNFSRVAKGVSKHPLIFLIFNGLYQLLRAFPTKAGEPFRQSALRTSRSGRGYLFGFNSSGRSRRVRSSACRRRHSAIFASCPERRMSGTFQPL